VAGLEAWLGSHKVRGAGKLAAAAVDAANAQTIRLPGEQVAACLIADLAEGVLALDEQIKQVDELIEGRFHRHPAAEVILSLPGMGVLLGAEFLAVTAGNMAAFGTPDRLASLAGVAPVPRDSGRVVGNLHRPQRYHRGLQRVFYTSALISIRCCPESRAFYDRKRAEANATPRPCSPWRAAGSTCCGRCCVTSAATSRPRLSPRPPDMPRHLTT